MNHRVKELLDETERPAVETDGDGKIVAWNAAAERLFGLSSSQVLGRPCYDVMCGRDRFGNRFCHEGCSVMEMVKRAEPVQRFEMSVVNQGGAPQDVSVDVVVLRGSGGSGHRILHFFDSLHDSEGESASRHEATNGDEALTPRELEVLRALASGAPTRNIAGDLGISTVTVRNHVQRILSKMRVHSRLEAVALAYRTQLIRHDDLTA